jgi:predicted nucleic acid-binding protein
LRQGVAGGPDRAGRPPVNFQRFTRRKIFHLVKRGRATVLPSPSAPGHPPRIRIIAATAELAGLTVLHLDKDFEIIADITGQPLEQLRIP